MASRTKQKEEARARRLAEEQAQLARGRRQRRLQMITGTVLVAVIIVAVAIAVSAGGGSGNKGPGLAKGGASSTTAKSVSSLLAGIPQSGAQLGSSKAPVTMIYYGDFECPICRDFTLLGGFPQLIQNDVRAGKVKVIYRADCTATCNGPDPSVFTTQQVAGLAAGKQNHFWNFAELFYNEQGTEDTNYVTDAYLLGLAKQIPGLGLAAWQTARADPTLATQIATDERAAQAAGVPGTPTLIFQGPTGKQSTPSATVPTYAELEQAIKQVA